MGLGRVPWFGPHIAKVCVLLASRRIGGAAQRARGMAQSVASDPALLRAQTETSPAFKVISRAPGSARPRQCWARVKPRRAVTRRAVRLESPVYVRVTLAGTTAATQSAGETKPAGPGHLATDRPFAGPLGPPPCPSKYAPPAENRHSPTCRQMVAAAADALVMIGSVTCPSLVIVRAIDWYPH